MTRTYYRLFDAWAGEGQPVITSMTFRVIRETPKGVWIVPSWASDDWPNARFVLNGTGKRYAYPDFEQAKDAYIRHKQSHIKHLKHALDGAEQRLRLAPNYTYGEHVRDQIARLDCKPPLIK